MERSFEPCLCGDPECARCFPVAASEPPEPVDPSQTSAEPPKTGDSAALYYGKLVDPETGEEIGEIATGQEFSQEWVEDAVRQIAWAEAKTVGAVATLVAAKTACENAFGPEVRRYERLVKYLRTIFEPHLRRFAQENLPKDKRSIKTPFGSLAFRKKPSRVKILNPEELARVLRVRGEWERVKVKSFTFNVNDLTNEEALTLAEIARKAKHDAEYSFDLEGLPSSELAAAIVAGAVEFAPEEDTFTVKV